jgi:hypothetical protein
LIFDFASTHRPGADGCGGQFVGGWRRLVSDLAAPDLARSYDGGGSGRALLVGRLVGRCRRRGSLKQRQRLLLLTSVRDC